MPRMTRSHVNRSSGLMLSPSDLPPSPGCRFFCGSGVRVGGVQELEAFFSQVGTHVGSQGHTDV